MSRRLSLLAMLLLVVMLAMFGGVHVRTAEAGSPVGTPEYNAEQEARRQMRQYWPAYRVQEAQMRSNRLSISIVTVNNGRRVDFRALVSKQNRRDGSYFYNVARPEKLYR